MILYDGMFLSVSWFVVIIVFHWHFELNRILTSLELDFLIRLCAVGEGEGERERERERDDILYTAYKVYLIHSPHILQAGPPP